MEFIVITIVAVSIGCGGYYAQPYLCNHRQNNQNLLKDNEENLRLEQQKQIEQAEIQKRLKEIEEENENIEKQGWDCKDQTRKPWQTEKVINVAVSGNSGVGKSSLVNSLLDLPKGQRARIGVTDCTDVIDRETCEPSRQSQQNQDGVKVLDVFDLPGCGTEKFPAASYIRDFGLRYFDLVIIVVTERITKADVMLKTELNKFDITTLVVRNKVDQAITTNQEENDIPTEETLAQLRKQFRDQGISDPFLISAKEKTYEWDEFVKKFNEENNKKLMK